MGVNLRNSTRFSDRSSRNEPNGKRLEFDAWTYGEVGTDMWNGNQDARWFKVKGTNLWVPSAYINGNPPNSTPMPGGSSGNIFQPVVFIPPIITLPNLGTPKITPQRYDRSSAVNYAKKYADKPNPTYHYFDYYEKCTINFLGLKIGCKFVGGDCTNFAAQCLIAGGILSVEEAIEKKEGNKIYLKDTFRVVDRLISYLLNKKLAVQSDIWNLSSQGKRDEIRKRLQPGDLIAFELDNDPNSPKDHLAVFIGV
jgi:hypothetical protein